MDQQFLFYLIASALTRSPVAGLMIAVAATWAAEGWWRGRLWRPWRMFDRWVRVRALRTTVATNPHDATARGELGRLLVERGGFAEAVAVLEPVVERYPKLPSPWYYLGRARLGLGDARGVDAVRSALELRPDIDYGAPWLRIGDFARDRADVPAAIEAYTQALAIHGSCAEAHYKLGLCWKTLGDNAAARAAFSQAIDAWQHAPPFKAPVDRPWGLRAWVAAR